MNLRKRTATTLLIGVLVGIALGCGGAWLFLEFGIDFVITALMR